MARSKTEDLPAMDGPGVGKIKDKRLESLADEHVDVKSRKAELASELTAIDGKIIDRMIEIGVKVFTYSDKRVKIVEGKDKVSVVTVETGDDDDKDE